MAENRIVEFPDRSVNDSGEIVDLQLWVDEFERYFDEVILSEIRAVIELGLQTALYILISCAIDFLVTFWAGSDSTRTHYQDFVNTFFVAYDGESVYRELRCRMLHNYTVGEHIIVCWDEPDLHGCTTDEGEVVLNREQFFDDFVDAKNRYLAALRREPDLLDNHIARFNEMGVLCSINPDDVREWVAAV